MKASKKPIDDFNHIDENLSEIEISELRALYRHYHKKYWLYKMVYYNRVNYWGYNIDPIVLGTISGAGVLLETFSEAKNYKKKVEMSKFAYTSYEKMLTDIRSFLREAEFNITRLHQSCL